MPLQLRSVVEKMVDLRTRNVQNMQRTNLTPVMPARLDLAAIEAMLQTNGGKLIGDFLSFSQQDWLFDQTRALLAHCRALRAAAQEALDAYGWQSDEVHRGCDCPRCRLAAALASVVDGEAAP